MLNLLKGFLQKFFGVFGLEIKKSNSRDKIIDAEFGDIYRKCRPYTMTSKERMYSLYKSVEYIIKSKIPGDFVECGVWRGGSAMVIAYTLLKFNEKNRKIYLYDTFKGMTEPTDADFSIPDDVVAKTQWKKDQSKNHNKWCFSPLDEVKKNMFSTKYPQKNILFVEGKVEETIPKFIPEKISLVRLDTDWYESTKHELTHLFPLLIKNGVLIIDDYGWWAGSKKATDEYFIKNKIPILLSRIDDTGRIGIKIN